MSQSKIISPAEVDFWLDSDKYSDYIDNGVINPAGQSLIFNIDMIRLSSIRKAISNFVRILTRRNIPVYFNDADANVNFGGKIIYISAKINTKQDFDVAVGQALHEGAHSLLSDFDMVKLMWANIPSSIFKASDAKNIRRPSIEKFIHTMWNIIEDRYIDTYVFNHAPGYRGYYVALYDRFWHNPMIDEYLAGDLFKYPSLASYDFRITNLTNENTDLMALPRLDDIARVIDISHIDRLKTTKDRIETAFEVVEIVLDCIDKQEKEEFANGKGTPQKRKGKKRRSDGLADPRDFFDFGEEEPTEEPTEGKEKDEERNDGSSEKDDAEETDIDVGKQMIDEISDVMSGRDPTPEKLKENKKAVNQIDDEGEVDEAVQKQLKDLIENQRKFLNGEIPKEVVTSDQKALLDLIEKHGIVLVRIDYPKITPGDDTNLKVDCIVVQKMTKELILSGGDVFPLAGAMELGGNPSPPEAVAEAVQKGIALGTKLGRKLQIRSEVNPVKIVRKKSGKINKRQLHEASFDADDLFYKINIEEHTDATLHITVDASGSMGMGDKWMRTMTSVVAICKAASMVDNIHVTVSFRSTQVSHSVSLPYIVLAYDSRKDKFSKVRTLFPYLYPNGFTPEGLAFSAIMNLFEDITPDEEERYFLNLSDGEPYYSLRVPHTGQIIEYTDEVGVNHTKAQVDKIRKQGVEILSYFIDDSTPHSSKKVKTEELSEDEKLKLKKEQRDLDASPLRKNFRKMYGKNAQFINVESIVDLAKTINGLFLSKLNEKRT